MVGICDCQSRQSLSFRCVSDCANEEAAALSHGTGYWAQGHSAVTPEGSVDLGQIFPKCEMTLLK